MLRQLAFGALLVCSRLAAGGDGPVPDFVPAGTNAVIGIHVRELADSELVRGLGADLLKTAGAKWNAASPFPGFDPLKDLDDVVIATNAQGEHPPTLVICHGRFPVDEIEKGAQRYRTVPIRQVENGAIALLDAGTIVGGDLKLVREAIDRRQAHTGGLSPELAQRAAQLSARYAAWGVGKLPQGFHASGGNTSPFDSLDRFDFGIGVSQGLQLAATLHVQSADDAQKLAATVQLFTMMAKAQPDAASAKIETHMENGTLTLALSVPEEALQKAMERQRAAIMQALAKQGSADPEPVAKMRPAAPAPAPRKTTIVSDPSGATLQVTLPGRR